MNDDPKKLELARIADRIKQARSININAWILLCLSTLVLLGGVIAALALMSRTHPYVTYGGPNHDVYQKHLPHPYLGRGFAVLGLALVLAIGFGCAGRGLRAYAIWEVADLKGRRRALQPPPLSSVDANAP